MGSDVTKRSMTVSNKEDRAPEVKHRGHGSLRQHYQRLRREGIPRKEKGALKDRQECQRVCCRAERGAELYSSLALNAAVGVAVAIMEEVRFGNTLDAERVLSDHPRHSTRQSAQVAGSAVALGLYLTKDPAKANPSAITSIGVSYLVNRWYKEKTARLIRGKGWRPVRRFWPAGRTELALSQVDDVVKAAVEIIATAEPL